MSEVYTGGGGRTNYPLSATNMVNVTGNGTSPASTTFMIDPAKRYFVHAAGTNTTSSNVQAGQLWYYDGNGNITTVKSVWAVNNSFSCTLSGTTLTVKNTLDGGYGSNYYCALLATLIPLDN